MRRTGRAASGEPLGDAHDLTYEAFLPSSSSAARSQESGYALTSKLPAPLFNTDFSRIFCDGPPRVIGVTDVPADTSILHFVPDSHDFSKLPGYSHLRCLSLNNISFDAATRRAIDRVATTLRQVEVLSVWNCKRLASDVLTLFPGVRYLQLTHAAAQTGDWSGLEALRELRGIFLIDAHKAHDLDFVAKVKGPLRVCSILGARSLQSLSGIDSRRETLTHVTLSFNRDGAATKRRPPLDVSPLPKLRALKRLELVGFDLDRPTVVGSLPSSAEVFVR